jgi:hypothetical protein
MNAAQGVFKDAVKWRHTRAELRHLFFLGTAREIPKETNLREYVATWHVQQQAINAGAKTPKFWRKAVGINL